MPESSATLGDNAMSGLAVVFGLILSPLHGQVALHSEVLNWSFGGCMKQMHNPALIARPVPRKICTEFAHAEDLRLVENRDHGKRSGANNEVREVETLYYRFKVPSDWIAGTETVKESLRQRMLPPRMSSAKESFRKKMQPPGVTTSVLEVFSPQVNNCSFVVYKSDLPPGYVDNDKYMDNLRKQNVSKFTMGMSQGVVKQVFNNERVNLSGGPAWLLDWEESRGGFRRSRMWVIHTKQRPQETLTFSSICNDEGYSAQKERFDKAAQSATAVTVNLPSYR